MIIIKINAKTLIISILIAILMYPQTIDFFINSGKNIYIAKQLSTRAVSINKNNIDYNKTKIIFMFDDGWKSVYSDAYGIMKKYDYEGSIPVIPLLIGEEGYMSYKEISELYLQGWDLLNHSYSHKENIYDDSNKLLSDFNSARQWMKNRYIGKHSDMIVMPYGQINPYLIMLLKDAQYRNIRTAENIIILDKNKIEYYPVTTINLLTDVTVNEVKDLLTQSFGESKTIILILHKIGAVDNGFGMTYSKDKLEEIIMFIDEHSDEFQVITYSQLLVK